KFLFSRKQQRHGLRVNRPHDVIRLRGEKREQGMLSSLSLPLACPQAPYARECEQRSRFIKCKPMRHLRAAICPLAKRYCRHQTAPTPPIVGVGEDWIHSPMRSAIAREARAASIQI